MVGLRRRAPDDTMLGWIGHTQRGDSAVPRGRGGRDGRDRLGGDGWACHESREGEITTVRGAYRIGGVRPDVIQRPGCQTGDGACEGTGRTDCTV